jgi:preprotein translocase SecE subunit
MTTHGATKRSRFGFRFVSETIAELKKVVWLTRREVAYLTALVLITAVSVGAVLGLLDWGFSGLTKLLLG